MDILRFGDTERVTVLALNSSGAPVTGATVTLGIRRDSDGFWWNGLSFQAAATTISMTELDSVNLPGVYVYDFRPGVTSIACLLYATSSTGTVANDPWVGQIRVGSWADNLDAAVSGLADSLDVIEILKRLDESDRNYARIVALINRLSAEVRR